MTLEEMRNKKKELGYSYEQIADYSGVPLSTVQKVFSGATQSPRYETLNAIQALLEDPHRLIVREPSSYGKATHKKQGEYTLTDYYSWPEDERIELIDGVIYDMGAPDVNHQILSSEISYHLKSYVREQQGRCIVLQAPLDVQLDCDEKTMVQPDVLVVCHPERFTKRNLFGAPDMVVEILSPATRKKDMSVKLQKYANAGVCEYWIVDPDKEKVIVYDLENEMDIALYTFQDQVPVLIFKKECKVDFREIREHLLLE